MPEREVGGAEATLELRPVGSGSSSTQSMDIVVSGFDIPHDGYLILLTGPFYARHLMPELRARPSCARRRQLTHAHAPGDPRRRSAAGDSAVGAAGARRDFFCRSQSLSARTVRRCPETPLSRNQDLSRVAR